MRKLILFSALIFVFSISTFPLFANNAPSYIERFKDIAIREMHRSGIPASITLAQAIHESGWGNGTLAVNSNNYFGIKCKDYWTGPTYYIEDDDFENGELIKSCFRAYERIEDSFVDHSDFLRDNPRYKELFSKPITDYQGWAKGLQNCGYATDTAYAEKLIRNIEKYGLHQYDTTPDPVSQVPQVAITRPATVSNQSTVASAPVFNIDGYFPASNPSEPVHSLSTNSLIVTQPEVLTSAPQNYEIPEEDYEVPAAYELPDDYVRGENQEEVPTLILGNIDWNELPETKTEDIQSPIKQTTAAPEIEDQWIPAPRPVEQPVSMPVPQSRPVEVMAPMETPASPSPQKNTAIVNMSYTGDKKVSQLSRRPRTSSERRR